MSNPFDDIKDFQLATGSFMRNYPSLDVPEEVAILRRNLMAEEFDEMFTALEGYTLAPGTDILAEIAKECTDVIVTVIGTMLAFGIDPEPVWKAVHRSNMAKVGPNGKVEYRKDGKVLKPEGWEPPDIMGEIRRQKETNPLNSLYRTNRKKEDGTD